MERPVSFAAEDIRDEKVRSHVERHFVIVCGGGV